VEFTVPYLTLQALGFATGTALSWLMAALLWKSRGSVDESTASAALRGIRRVEIALPLAGSCWTGGSFAMQIILLAGWPMQSRAYALPFAVAWLSTFWMPSMWLRLRDHAATRRPRFRGALMTISVLMPVGLTIALLTVLFTPALRTSARVQAVLIWSAYNAIAHAAVILFVYRWERSTPVARFIWRAVLPLAALQVFILMVLVHFETAGGVGRALAFVSQQAMIPNVIVVASFVAKFRYADVLLKRSLNVMLSVIGASIVVWWIPGIKPGIPVVIASLVGAGLLLASLPIHRAVNWIVDRGLLRRPEYGALVRTFVEESDRVANPTELVALAEKTVRAALHLDSVKITAATEPATGERFPITGSDLILVVSPTASGRRLLTEEMVFLQAIAGEVSRRLDALEFERERGERQHREERLRHSLTEAELKALRAQVDPHFLFNTLNTIADLITSDPEKAEGMTERLAEFFRYTLTRTEQTLATLDEELQFVRHYLDIEQVRFGERLRVELSTSPGIAHEMVPALILQPIVENAIRHGLAPKPGGGCISISAAREGRFLRLQVADDGVGIRQDARRQGGVGLQNVRERLRALYGDDAHMNIDSGSAQGTRVSLLLPANGH
jgi:two-component system LytT family sensor kinase